MGTNSITNLFSIRYNYINKCNKSTKVNKKHKNNKFGLTNCTKLVPYGSNIGSTINIGRLLKNIQKLTYLPMNFYSIIVGKLLSDGWLEKENLNANTRFRFKQSLSKSSYVIHSFLILSHYISNIPNIVKGERKGTITYGLQFSTRRYQCFNELYNLFYINKIKVIPHNIYDILTPIALAHWIMGDGARKNKGLILCTDSYSLSDVIKLSNVLRIKYNLDTTISGYINNKPRIYIVPYSMPTLIKLVKPYVLESFWYKLQLNIYINN
jgi:hypothetical protein